MKKLYCLLMTFGLIAAQAQAANFPAQQAFVNSEPPINKYLYLNKVVTTHPYSFRNFIKVSAQGLLCGSFNIKIRDEKNIGTVRLDSTLAEIGPNSILYPIGETYLQKGEEKSFKYNWAGLHPESHFRIFCLTVDPERGSWQPVNCDEVVFVTPTKHNVPCVGPLGPQAEYGELNLNK